MKDFGTLKNFVQERPLKVIVWKFYCRVLGIKIHRLSIWKNLIVDKAGVEIGGPSGIFTSKGFLPIYTQMKSLDGVNFSTNTIWEGEVKEGNYFKFENKTGYQYIGEGTNLNQIPDSKYDFVLSCNNLEHIANPIKAIKEWKRVIKKDGIIILVLPKKESNFDHRRPITKFDHIVADFLNEVSEDDLTHLPEFLLLHDLSRDPQAGTFENFKQRSQNVSQTRAIHHHVFDMDLLQQLVAYVNMKVILHYTSPTDYFIAAVK